MTLWPCHPRNFPYPLKSGGHFHFSIFLQQLYSLHTARKDVWPAGIALRRLWWTLCLQGPPWLKVRRREASHTCSIYPNIPIPLDFFTHLSQKFSALSVWVSKSHPRPYFSHSVKQLALFPAVEVPLNPEFWHSYKEIQPNRKLGFLSLLKQAQTCPPEYEIPKQWDSESLHKAGS